MTSRYILYFLGAIVIAGILYVAYYAISPLFVNIQADEILPTATQEETASTTASSTAEEIATGEIIDTSAHPASGTVRLIEVGDTYYVRYENLKTINGPDIYVYLSKDLDAREFVNLGRVRATEGNINYEIPSGVDPKEYRYVLIWCKAFGVLFNYADLGQ